NSSSCRLVRYTGWQLYSASFSVISRRSLSVISSSVMPGQPIQRLFFLLAYEARPAANPPALGYTSKPFSPFLILTGRRLETMMVCAINSWALTTGRHLIIRYSVIIRLMIVTLTGVNDFMRAAELRRLTTGFVQEYGDF